MVKNRIFKTVYKTINLLSNEFGKTLIEKNTLSFHEYSDADLVLKNDKLFDLDFLSGLNSSGETNIYNNYSNITISNCFVNQVIKRNAPTVSYSSVIGGNLISTLKKNRIKSPIR